MVGIILTAMWRFSFLIMFTTAPSKKSTLFEHLWNNKINQNIDSIRNVDAREKLANQESVDGIK